MAKRLETDWVLFFTVLAMVCFGLVTVYSASSVIGELQHQQSAYFFLRQLGWAVFAIAVMMFLKRQDYRLLHGPLAAFLGLGLVTTALLVVYVVDTHSHRWLRFGPLNLQPAEFAKPAIVVFLASFLAHRSRVINQRHTILPMALVVGVVAALVGAADLGNAVVIVMGAAAMMFVAGVQLRVFVAGLVITLILLAVAIAAKPYRLSRIVGFVDPHHMLLDRLDPSGRVKAHMQSGLSTRDTSYQARQSRIAIGAGGVLGAGLMEGKQKLLYLPEAHTDFIYAVIGEELGLVGCLLVLAGFLVIFWRGLLLYQNTSDEFGSYLALGITSMILFQALINISVVLDLGPTKGLTLPMISHGGGSLLSTLTSVGLLLSVSERSG